MTASSDPGVNTEVTRARGANGNIDLVSGGRIGLRGSVVDLTGGKPFVVLVE